MLLTCVGINPMIGESTIRDVCGLRIGCKYDVAEIAEHLATLMVRNDPSSPWPRPGDQYFGLDPYLFEQAPTPIEVVSCGFVRSTYLVGQFGYLVVETEVVDRIERCRKWLDSVPFPEQGESANKWCRTVDCPRDIPREILDLLCDNAESPLFIPELLTYSEIIHPSELVPKAGAIVLDCSAIVRNKVHPDDAAALLSRTALALGIADSPPRILDHEFWMESRAPRIINERAADY